MDQCVYPLPLSGSCDQHRDRRRLGHCSTHPDRRGVLGGYKYIVVAAIPGCVSRNYTNTPCMCTNSDK